ncbi:hypothetical protein AXG93_421s1100 [Marchantia polymorpha subsp. ruderalis]|uniref:Uncharacterized protein n=1 Tax=Marchantia polymorpha subsp. ruderalis TaxID=1480154 RepID=A0A176VJK6_MARPO|nr:hypothetical protein AXG93_421s1100 [Marchantia polymorpha subsp. ruderalis]
MRLVFWLTDPHTSIKEGKGEIPAAAVQNHLSAHTLLRYTLFAFQEFAFTRHVDIYHGGLQDFKARMPSPLVEIFTVDGVPFWTFICWRLYIDPSSLKLVATRRTVRESPICMCSDMAGRQLCLKMGIHRPVSAVEAASEESGSIVLVQMQTAHSKTGPNAPHELCLICMRLSVSCRAQESLTSYQSTSQDGKTLLNHLLFEILKDRDEGACAW